MWWLRLLLIVLVLVAVLVAAVPILVLLDLLQGGTGYGLCPGGLESCRNPMTATGELIVILTVALLLVVAMIRAAVKLARQLEARRV
ncbi:MAG TPA: hypothetical protein VID03_08220 [Acidimicrobiia bacterium]|jgi:hypothetical protein